MANKKMAGCSYGKVNRNMIDNLVKGFDNFKDDLGKRFDKIDESQTELFNHQSSRLPMWATILFTVGGSLLTGLLVWVVTH